MGSSNNYIAEDNSASGVWKTYGEGDEYGTNKLLKVFLTKITFVPDADCNFTYNAYEQKVVVKAETENGVDVVNVYKNDGAGKEIKIGHIETVSEDADAAHSLADYLNSMGDNDLSALLMGNSSMTNAGEYEMFTSQQIVTTGKSNNLGFDVVSDNTVKVDKAELTILVKDTEIKIGETPSYTGSISGLANGDDVYKIGIGGYDLDSSVNIGVAGTYTDKIGVLIGGTLYFDDTDVLQNYKVTIDPGTLTVKADSPVDPDPTPTPNPDPTPGKPDIGSHNPDIWQAEAKYPWYKWDKQRNERERKAEVHFVDGGMAI